jgi:multiple sugar transport system permease protein
VTETLPTREKTACTVPQPRRLRHRLLRGRSDLTRGLLLLLPFVGALVLFQYVAIGLVVRNSFFSYGLLDPGRAAFVGLGNYRYLFSDPQAAQSVEVTALFGVGSVLTQVPLGLALAVLLNRQGRGATVLRAIVFSPVVSSVVVVSTMWTFIFDPQEGLANGLLHTIGLPGLSYLTSQNQALGSVLVMTLWEQVGFSMVLYLAGLQAIPVEYEEAAVVDGAGSWQRFFTIVLPLLRRTTALVVVTATVFAFQAFAQAFIMTSGGPNGATNFLTYNIYTQAFTNSDPGYASTLSVVLLLIVLAVSLLELRLLRSKVD